MLVLGFLITPKHRVTDKLDFDRFKPRIRCPLCHWQPQPHDRWCCSPGCGEVWNTFATRGECPGCQRRWTHTACHRCDTWSPHDDWYYDEDAS